MIILSSLLSQNLVNKNDYEKVVWLVNILKWLQRPRSDDEKSTKVETVYTVRIKYILSMLNNNPEWLENFVITVSSLVYNLSSVSQYANAGFTSNSFVHEFVHRIQEKILPQWPFNEDLETLIYEVFPHEIESLYIDFVDETVLEEMLALFSRQSELHKKLRTDLLAASYVLSVEVLSNVFAIHKELNITRYRPEGMPEYKLEGLLRSSLNNKDTDVQLETFKYLTMIEKNTNELESSMQDTGVKIQLVYLFQIQKRILNRQRILLSFLNSEIPNAVSFRLFLSRLVLDSNHQKSFSSFIKDNLSLLTDRIVQTTSHIGEHYVTFTWVEFQNMFKSATGGGTVTAMTVFIKFLLLKLELTGFIKGLFDSLNYSASFLAIQVMGWTLATKQPSTTAPFIASQLTKSSNEARQAIVALLRTQFIAVLGNLSTVFPICFSISYFLMSFELPIIDYEHSLEVIGSTNITGPSILFAAYTGILLFTASLIAGWFENWVIVNQLGKRIRNNKKLRFYFGENASLKIANFFSKNSNALSANISLGLMLGFLPQINKFMGLPLDVRHVTLATGGFATALPVALRGGVDGWPLVNALGGILTIGLMNISVSFFMAFLLASTSSKVKFKTLFSVLIPGFVHILKKPWLLFVPEKETSPERK